MTTTVRTRDEERRSFLFYLIGTIILALPVGHLFFTMWTVGAYQFFRAQIELPLVPAGGTSLQPIVMFGSGLYLTWLLLFGNDWRKRYQGYILIFGTVITIGVLTVLGIGIPNMNLISPINIGAFVIGAICGIVSELRAEEDKLGGDLTKLDLRHEDSTWAHWITTDRGRNTPAEFPIAYRGLVLFIASVVLGANVLNMAFNESLGQVVLHFGASGMLLYLLYGLLDINIMTIEGGDGESNSSVQFEREEEPSSIQFEVLGPQQSGKTYLALGLNLTLTRDDKYDIKSVDGKMPDIIEEHADRLMGVNSGLVDWGIGNTMIDAAEKIKIEFTKKDTKRGELLTATVNMFDYPGEVLGDVAEKIEQRRGRKMTDGGQPPSDNTPSSEEPNRGKEDLGTLNEIAEQVQQNGGKNVETTETKRTGTEEKESKDDPHREAGEDQDVRDEVRDALIRNLGAADKLVVLIDSQRFVTGEEIIDNDSGMMLKEMTRIVQGAGPEEIIPVATKADFLMEGYESLDTETQPTEEEFKNFRDYVQEKLDTGHPLASTLLELADYPVFPVYYRTGKDENGEYKLRVEDGVVHPIGYDELIDAVMEQ